MRSVRYSGLFTNLQPALDEVEGRDGGVGDAARQDAAQAAERVVLGRPELARVLLRGRRRQGATARSSGARLPDGKI